MNKLLSKIWHFFFHTWEETGGDGPWRTYKCKKCGAETTICLAHKSF